MPDDYYVSQYSGEEIDALLSGAGAGTVRYDAAQTLTTAQKQQARTNIWAAPSGFGWGEELPQLVSTAAEVDAITANSVVRYANDLTNLVDGDSGSYTRYAIVVTYSVNTTDKAQDAYCYGGGAHGDVMLHRGRSGNTWLPWEWVNPPMVLSVEYRTTERYLGKPVYVKVVDCGAAADGKAVEHGIAGISNCISAQGISSVALPQMLNHDLSNDWSVYISQFTSNLIRIECGTSITANITVILKYTK